MSDVAQLGLAVDSSQVTGATTALNQFSGAANNAATSADRLNLGNGKLGPTMRTVETMAQRAGVSVEEMSKRIQAQSANISTATAAQNKYISLVQQVQQVNQTAVKAANENNAALSSVAKSAEALGRAAETNTPSVKKLTDILKEVGKTGGDPNKLLAVGQSLGVIGIGFTLAFEAARTLYEYLKSQGPTLEAALKEQDRLLGVVRDSYDKVAMAAKNWLEQSKDVTQLQLLQQQIDLQKKLNDEVGKAVSKASTFANPGDFFASFGGGQQIKTVKEQFAPFNDALVDLQEGFRKGQPDVRAFVDEVARIALATPALQKLGADLIASVADATKAENAIKQVKAALDLLNGNQPSAEDRSRLGLPDPPKINATRDALTRATDAVEKYILQTEAQTKTVGMSVAEQEKARVIADLTAAALRDGKKDLQQYASAWDEIGTRAGKAREELVKAQVHDQIKFQQDTALLSPEDVQIAQQLRGLYPDVAQSLSSVEAAQLRVINLQKDMKDSAVEFAKTFTQGLMQGKSIMDSLVGSLDQLSSKLMNSGIENLLSFNPAQMGIGALQVGASALINMFTGDQKAKKALQEAQDAWKKMADQVTNFKHAADDVDFGPLTQKLQSLFATMTQLTQAAAKAKEWGAVAELQNKYNEAVVRSVDEFVNGASVLTDLQQKIKAVNDEAIGLRDAAPDRAAMIEQGRLAQIAKATADFVKSTVDGLQADLNAAAGNGYLNDLAADIKKYNDLLSQGIDKDLLSRWLSSQVQKIASDANLAGGALAQFNAMLAGTGTMATAAAADLSALQAVYDAATAQVSTSRQDLTDAYGRESSAIQSTISQLTTFIANFNKFRDSLKLSEQLSDLGPQQRLDEARRQYQETLQAALSGDASAQGSLQDIETTYLQIAREYYGPTSAYVQILRGVQDDNARVAASATQQVSLAQQQLDAMTAQVGQLVTINNSVLSVAQAISNLTAALAAQKAAQGGLASGVASGGSSLSASSAVSALYSGVLGREGDSSGAAYWQSQFNSGLTGDDLVRAFTYAAIQNGETVSASVRARYGLASGGWIMGGIPGVDSVPLNGTTMGMPEEFVVNRAVARANANWLPSFNATGRLPSNDNSDVVYQLKAIVNAVVQSGSANAAEVRAALGEIGKRLDAIERTNRIEGRKEEIKKTGTKG